VMEWWTGWFDYWGEEHHGWSNEDFELNLGKIIGDYGASINYYMFHGGTNFGWMNGANWNMGSNGKLEYQPVITSYDYDSPLTEYGQLTEKANITRRLIAEKVGYPIPEFDEDLNVYPVAYPVTSAKEAANLWRNLYQMENFVSQDKPLAMEMFPVNKNRGQPYGYALYQPQVTLEAGQFTIDGLDKALSGRANIFVNQENKYQYTNTPGNQDIPESLTLTATDKSSVSILMENSGRINYKKLNDAYTGLTDLVGVNGNFKLDWQTFSLPMDNAFINNLKWDIVSAEFVEAPAFYRFELNIEDPEDTFLEMSTWGKGQAWVNGENLGRYWSIGPAQTMYVPGCWLKQGLNEFILFEEIKPASPRTLRFSDTPILDKLQ